MPGIKAYSQHKCTRQHRTYKAFAKCVWPKAAWISGEGPYATVTRCPHSVNLRGVITVMLHKSVEVAQHALREVNNTGCGGQCIKKHELIELRMRP